MPDPPECEARFDRGDAVEAPELSLEKAFVGFETRWLSQHTATDFAFFAVCLRVVRIGDSPMASLFDVLERPNVWEKRLQETA